jgi:hypothetical protein
MKDDSNTFSRLQVGEREWEVRGSGGYQGASSVAGLHDWAMRSWIPSGKLAQFLTTGLKELSG